MSRIINKRCETCDKVIKYSNYWDRHCKTKKHLKNLQYIDESQNVTECNRNVTECNRNVTECNRNVTECNRNVTECNQDTEFQCKYCNKGFKQSQGRSRHENHRCKQRPIEVNQIINNNTNTNNNTTNNSNSNNTLNQTTNNQITLNVYGEETIPRNFLTNDLFDKLKLCEGDLTKTYLLLNDELYLKNKKNDNIKYTNIQSEYCQILSKDNDWKLKRLLEVMNERGIVVKQELEKELERIISEEGIKNDHIIIDPKMKQLQIMYLPMSKFEDNIEKIDDEDDDIKELYKRYQLELYNLRTRKNK